MNTIELSLTEGLQIAVTELADALMETGPVADFKRAQSRYDTDAEVRALIDEYRAVQVTVRAHETDGTVTRAEIDQLRGLYQRVQTQETIAAFARSQRLSTHYLEQVVYELNDLIGLDFASFGTTASCCS